jgi:RNA polymerase sigma factor (sigma-70 family)
MIDGMLVALASSATGSDLELLGRYARGRCANAFGLLVRRYVDLVYSAAVRQVRDAHLAEDVTQEVFVLLSREAGRMDDRVILAAWLYRATRLVSCNANKKAARRRRHEMASITLGPARGGAGGDDQWKELVPLLDEAMAGLREGDRAALLLRYFRGQSMKEVGDALGLEANTASKRIERAVEKLRAFFARRGVTVGAAAVVATLEAHAVSAAPAHLAEAVSVAASAAGAAGAGAIAKGAVIGMAMTTQVKTAAGVAAAIVLAILGTTIAYLAGAFGGSRDQHAGPTSAPMTSSPVVAAAAPDPSIGPGGPDDVRLPGGRWASELADYIPGGTRATFNNHRRPGRALFLAIHGEHFDEQQGVERVEPGLRGLDEGDWVKYEKVDFGKGGEKRATSFLARLAADPPADGEPRSILVRIERPDGPVIATLSVTPTNWPKTWAAQATPVTTAISGVHDVYLTFGGGKDVARLDWFKFMARRDVAGRIEAESFDDAEGIQDGAFFLSNLDRPDYLLYRNVDFGPAPGPVWFHTRLGVKDGWDGRVIQVKLDRLDGRLIAGLTTRSTGAYQKMEVQSVACAEVSGVHDVYIRFTGNGAGDIDWFEFNTNETPPANDVGRLDGPGDAGGG